MSRAPANADGNPRGALALYRGAGLTPTVKTLGATSFLQDVASEMVYPLLPGFLLSLGGGPVLLGAMESLSEGVLALVKGAAGRMSDRLAHRKPFVVAGYGLSALLRPLLAMAAAAWQVVALRGLDRLAKGLRTAPRDAMIAEATPAERRAFAFSFHRGLDHLGAAAGPLLAALILVFAAQNPRLVFALATIPALGGAALVLFGTQEAAAPRRQAARSGESASSEAADLAPTLVTPASPGLRRPALPPRLWLTLGAFFLFSLGNASDAFLLLRAADLGYSAMGLTLLWSGFHVAKWLASAPSGRLADHLGHRRPILIGWGIYALVYLGFAVAVGPWAVAGLFAVYAGFYGLTEGAERALTIELAGTETGTGTALGAFHLATGLGTFGASLLFGFLWQLVSPAAAFATGAALAGAAAILLVGLGKMTTPALD